MTGNSYWQLVQQRKRSPLPIMVSLFFMVQVANNAAYGFNISMPLQMIFRAVSICLANCMTSSTLLIFFFNQQQPPPSPPLKKIKEKKKNNNNGVVLVPTENEY
jgi:hypothetical protein